MNVKFYFFATLLSCCISFTASAASVTAVSDGPWSLGATWSSGQAPQAGDDVLIPAEREVIYDVQPNYAIKSILIKGKLSFSRSNDTQLTVGMILITDNENVTVAQGCGHGAHGMGHMPGVATLEVGTAAEPIPANVNATISLEYFAGQDDTCAPGIVNHGRMDIHGAPLDHTWVKLQTTAAAGSNQVQLLDAVDWNVGDKIIVTGTNRNTRGHPQNIPAFGGTWAEAPRTEERLITAISGDGRTLTLNQNLVHKHDVFLAIPEYIPYGAVDRRGDVALLTRNVVIESTNPSGVRGHTMYHEGSTGSLSYAEFRHLGKRGLVGRYPVHFHVAKDGMRGSYVDGLSIWDSDNRWVTVHATEYLVVTNTVAYSSRGHGFFLEDGSETLNYFGNNLGVVTYWQDPLPGQALAYDQNRGACYWAANARNFIVDNTYAECDNDDSFFLDYDWSQGQGSGLPTLARTAMLNPDGTRSDNVDTRFISGGLVKGLEVHTHWGWGPWIRGANFPETDPLVFKDTKVWGTHYSFDISASNVVFDGVANYNSPYGFYNEFPGSHLVKNAYCQQNTNHGCYMTYLGGGGVMLYDNTSVVDSKIAYRITAANQEGPGYDPIEVHVRNSRILDPQDNTPNGNVLPSWAGTEDDNHRSNPLLMLVIHDVFGPNQDAVVLPHQQSLTQPGVPAGLTFVDGSAMTDPNGTDFEGRGDMRVAEGNVPFPDSPLLQPAIDTLPPATVVLSPQTRTTNPISNGVLYVKGVSLDAHELKKVVVNGIEASIASNGIDWSVFLSGVAPGPFAIEAYAEDMAGNVEMMRHTVDVDITQSVAQPTVPNPPTNLSVT